MTFNKFNSSFIVSDNMRHDGQTSRAEYLEEMTNSARNLYDTLLLVVKKTSNLSMNNIQSEFDSVEEFCQKIKEEYTK